MTRVRLLLLATLALLLPLALVGPASAQHVTRSDKRDGTVLKWRGKEAGASLPLSTATLPGAPHDFRRFVRQQLTAAWHDLGHTPACKSAPLMTVRALRTDGYAFGDFGTYPQPGCPTGGGYEAFWAIRHGEWKQVIGTQDVVDCARLEKLAFPSELGVHQCYDGTEVVTYTHA